MFTHDELTISPDACSQRSGHASPPPSTRVYRKRGRKAHFLERVIFTGCQRPEEDESVIWLGTGSQDEYERAARLPMCVRCFRSANRGQIQDPRLGAGHGQEMT